MGLYGLIFKKVRSEDYKILLKVIQETNFRLRGGDGTNQALMFISGKLTFINKPNKDLEVVCNIRPMFHIPFFKHIFKHSFKRALKKEGYKGRPPRFLMFSELSNTLEGII